MVNAMAFEVYCKREGNHLGAVDAISAEAIAGIKAHETVTVSIRRSRNGKHHRKLFALLKIVFDNQTAFATTEQLLDALKLATGLFDIGKTVDGIPFTSPRSISFASMCQSEFEQWYDKAVEVILTKILPGVNRADLEAQVLEILGDYQPKGASKWQAA